MRGSRGDYFAGYPREQWSEPSGVHEIAKRLAWRRRPWLASYTFSRQVKILGRVAGQRRPVDLTEKAHSQLASANAALWEARLSSLAARELASAAPGAPLLEGKESESKAFLRWLAKELQLKAQPEVQALALVYLFEKAPLTPLAVLNADEWRSQP